MEPGAILAGTDLLVRPDPRTLTRPDPGPTSRRQGLSTELGAFVAGVMLSATDQQEHCLSLLEHLKQFFLSLFVSSIGLVISPTFLAQHLRVLAGGLALTIACKTILARRLAACRVLGVCARIRLRSVASACSVKSQQAVWVPESEITSVACKTILARRMAPDAGHSVFVHAFGCALLPRRAPFKGSKRFWFHSRR